jgi:hypothetical protein
MRIGPDTERQRPVNVASMQRFMVAGDPRACVSGIAARPNELRRVPRDPLHSFSARGTVRAKPRRSSRSFVYWLRALHQGECAVRVIVVDAD